MSRVANNPVELPNGVEVTLGGTELSVKGARGILAMPINEQVEIKQEDNMLTFAARSSDAFARAMSGTTRSLVNNMVTGVTQGFEKKLDLVGVGYRAQVQGSKINLTLGFSHPVVYELPDGVTAETPSQTEVLLKSSDKQKLGQVAAEIRAFRPPEPYKGKGVRISGEYVRRKEAKKK
ncbi:MAG: 50S ribosomal protein L6 [Proteobacteria bacterium]|jgi:large subunit ribosomal protein L6|uniref:Large ribosomal subunit protein uL6 n=1 Tax=SAR92 bacterium BACL26 MAG-121220-bin70 TaxID=1655626 RepID=A0A0R2U4G5_9GAMM|nr:MAG: 50S ribosomal protein L6 [SAR92 bacterium BACL26 MAG-121220-bin70]MDA0795191.1 50S ribosomal protein L6 [Pseudomonadota bacterium]MDA1351333.1 50S ribosomal protein L6 [Pseudomonadota bacterium]|tara:strand:- start:2801 stop:3334 length:534 start_codon:yes stop_codon:yes gene_type:complete